MRISDWSSDVCSSDLPHAIAGRALVPRGTRFRRPHHARDVEMRPFHALVDKALDELRGGDRSAIARAGILDVGDLAVDHLVIGIAQRKPPDLIAGRLTRRRQLPRQAVVIGEQPGIFMPQGNEHRRSEEQTSELQSLMSTSYAVVRLKKKK